MELTILKHWIGGKAYVGPVERWGDVFNPAIGASNTRASPWPPGRWSTRP